LEKDLDKATHYFEQLNQTLNSEKFNNFMLSWFHTMLGNCHEYGFGVEINLEKATAEYLKAANVGSAAAQFRMCLYYHKLQNHEQAAHYFQMLCQANHPDCNHRLNERYRNISFCYANGIGVEVDLQRAEEFHQQEVALNYRFLVKTWI
jgi:TPR repeat protein